VNAIVILEGEKPSAEQQQRMLAALTVGDPVVTIGGLHGEVLALDPTTVDLVVTYDDDGVTPDVVLRFDRSSIARVDAPAAAASTDGDGPAA
jgi:preprotein translocase subunit YajC